MWDKAVTGRDAMQDAGRDERLTVADAADRLGISKEAVRKRISRGTLRSDKDSDGTVRVYVPPSDTTTGYGDRGELVEALRDEVAHLRRESERKDEIIMSLSLANAEMSRTIRAIEAPAPQEPPEATYDSATEQPGRVGPQTEVESPQGPAESPVTVADEQQGRGPVPDTGGPQEPAERVSWWRRMFGG
jgi:hypothetical protein